MIFVNKVMEIIFRFVGPIIGIIFFAGALYVVISGVYPPDDDDGFRVHYTVVASVGLLLSVALLLLANFTKIRHRWTERDRELRGLGSNENSN
jgi:hypothetical protein